LKCFCSASFAHGTARTEPQRLGLLACLATSNFKHSPGMGSPCRAPPAALLRKCERIQIALTQKELAWKAVAQPHLPMALLAQRHRDWARQASSPSLCASIKDPQDPREFPRLLGTAVKPPEPQQSPQLLFEDAADVTTPLGKVSQGPCRCQPGFLGSQPSTLPVPLGPAQDSGKTGGLTTLPPQPPLAPCPPPCLQPCANHINLNAFLLNSYKTEYKILASGIVIKENFSSAASGHLVHTVKCLFLWVFGFFFSFLFCFLFVFYFSFSFLFSSQPPSRGQRYKPTVR